jgi:flagellar P-ring protein precursor FlgI
MRYFALFFAIALAMTPRAEGLTRLKDLGSIEGVRDNQLIGYGLVVGLAGTGDRRQTLFSAQTLTNLLQRMGVTVSPTAITVKNTAAVIVTATMPPFAQPGAKVDVTVSSVGDAANLQGGLLVMTPLRGANNQVYAVGQGAVLTGGFAAGGPGASKVVNHPTVGRIPEGGLIERPAPSTEPTSEVKFQLRQMDFGTASIVAKAINEHYPDPRGPIAHAENGSVVAVAIPASYMTHSVDFLADVQKITVDPEKPAPKIVVNERTGTIVMGKTIRVLPVAIMHGSLTVEIQTVYSVSQPAPFSQGSTQVVPQTQVGAGEEKAKNIVLKDGATVEDLVRGLTAIGSTARDIIAILQDLRAAGALEADLEVI